MYQGIFRSRALYIPPHAGPGNATTYQQLAQLLPRAAVQCANSSPPSAHTCALGLRALKCVKLSACSKHALEYKRELSASVCTLAVSINGELFDFASN